MDVNILKGKWKQMRGEAQRQWGKLTGDDLDVIEGDRDKLIGKIQERYGKQKDEAEKEVNKWLSSTH
ncbi:CsbD family protein [Desulfocurvibacter africanus]|uniref:CsbD family protein n=1 Tax=Desulfocurvibacter africanus subsp. africanus str. Walvis Bay TaxID=690850 RepID=F3Z3P7_DESAF|nr:CsbD family protein [Desulfocurvibacter africanus]EGJ51512.1 CsbD family protein [Desulfocurvibacter africanus subsp. africanus str. Walvis Bay]